MTLTQGSVTQLFKEIIDKGVENPDHPPVKRLRDNGYKITTVLDHGYRSCSQVVDEPTLRYEVGPVSTEAGDIPSVSFQVYLNKECEGPYLFEVGLLLFTSEIPEDFTPAMTKSALLDELVTSYSVSDIYDPIKAIIKPDDVVIGNKIDVDDTYIALTLIRQDIQTLLIINHKHANEYMLKHSTNQ